MLSGWDLLNEYSALEHRAPTATGSKKAAVEILNNCGGGGGS